MHYNDVILNATQTPNVVRCQRQVKKSGMVHTAVNYPSSMGTQLGNVCKRNVEDQDFDLLKL